MDKKKKMIIIGVAAVVVIAAVLVLCLVCFHSWQDATCEAPKTCEKCGKTEGEALGHEWVVATCTEPKHCLHCGKTEGAVLPHKWKEASCVDAKTCTVCGKTDGEPLGHDVTEWTVTRETSCALEGERAGFCERCKKDCTEPIEKLPHTESDWTVEKDYVINSDASVTPGTEVIVCTVCKEQIRAREYTVELTISQKNAALAAYDEVNFWHCGPDFLIYTVLADFRDFPLEDAELVVSHMNMDWDKQAVMYAKENCSGTSKAELSDDMRHYGFDRDQIEMALKEVGY